MKPLHNVKPIDFPDYFKEPFESSDDYYECKESFKWVDWQLEKGDILNIRKICTSSNKFVALINYEGHWYNWAIAQGYDTTLMCAYLRVMNKREGRKMKLQKLNNLS